MPVHSPEVTRLTQPRPDVRGDSALRVRSIQRLQQTIGNREVVRMLVPPPDASPIRQSGSIPAAQLPTAAAAGFFALWQQGLALIRSRLVRRRAVACTAEPPGGIEGPK